MTKNAENTKWLLLIALSCIWGSSFILVKKGLEHYNYIQAATIRLSSAGLILLPFALYQIKNIPKHKWKYILLAGFSAMSLPAYLFCYAQQYVPSGLAGMINSLTPTSTFLISLLFFKSKYNWIQVAGLFLGLVGSVYLSSVSTNGNSGLNLYALMIVLATFCYGLNINIVKNYLQDISPWAVSTCSVAFAGMLSLLVFGLPRISTYHINQTTIFSFLALSFLGLLGTALAIILHNKLIKISNPLFASANTYFIPIVSIFWGLMAGETFGIHHFIGIAIVLTAVLLIRKQT